MHKLIFNEIGFILFFASLAQYLSWRFKIPNIILLSFFGLLIGPVFSLVSPKLLFGDFFEIIIELTVVVLLFEGGLSLKFSELKGVSSGVKRLISFGIIINGFLTSCAAYYIANLSLPVSLTLGAILIVTGPTVIVPILRQVNLGEKVSRYLKWEAIINDPLGILITTVIYQYFIFHASGSFMMVLFLIFKAVAFAVVSTLVVGFSLKTLFQSTKYPDFLKVPTVFSVVLMVFILAKNFQDGAGLLAVTSLGIFFANQKMLVFNELKKFKESVSVFSVSLVFILMSSSLDFSLWSKLGEEHYTFILLVVFVIRLVSIILATIKSDMEFKAAALVGFFGPRGIVAASIAGIIGSRLELAGIKDSEFILPIVFAVIFATVLIHSFSLEPLANLLNFKVEKGNGLIIVGSSKWSVELAKLLTEHGVNVLIVDSNWHRLKHARNYLIPFHYGEIVMSVQEGELDLGKYSYLLASSDRNTYNIYVCNSLVDDVGLNNVYQIPLSHHSEQTVKEIPEDITTNILHDKELVFHNLKEKVYYGWSFKATHITKEFKLSDFNKLEENQGAVNILIIKPNKDVQFIVDPNNIKVGLDDYLVSFNQHRN